MPLCPCQLAFVRLPQRHHALVRYPLLMAYRQHPTCSANAMMVGMSPSRVSREDQSSYLHGGVQGEEWFGGLTEEKVNSRGITSSNNVLHNEGGHLDAPWNCTSRAEGLLTGHSTRG